MKKRIFASILSVTFIASPLMAQTTTTTVITPSSTPAVNTITSTAPEASTPADAQLQGLVRANISAHSNSADKVNVTVHNGVVSLSGTVKTQAEADGIVSAAKHTSGVVDVNSTIIVVVHYQH